MHLTQQRETKNSDIDSRAKNAGHQGARCVGPTFGHQGNTIRPYAAHSQSDQESQK